jgi:signal transduction histidine kinase/AraC-like DNA-binding protein
MAAAVLAETHQLGFDQVRDLCRQLLDSFVSDLVNPQQSAFRGALDRLLPQALEAGRAEGPEDDEIDLWQNAISILAGSLPAWVPAWEDLGMRTRAYELVDIARIAISAGSRRYHRKYVVDQRWTVDRIGRLTADLLTALDETQVYQVLAEHLPQMGISLAAVAELTEEGNDPLAWSTLRLLVPGDPPVARCATRSFPPRELARPGDEPWSLALVPLVGTRRQLGYVAFESAQLPLYGAIVQQVAAALNTAQLYRDATEGRRLAEEANQLKSRFLSTVSHELRTPLNLVVGLSSILLHEEGETGAALPPALLADLERIYANAQHLGALINDVLDLAGSEAGHLSLIEESVDLGQLLHAAAKTGRHLAAAKGLAWREDLPAAGPWVCGDRTRLQQVALNLISNAVKYTPQGEVSLSLTLLGDEVTVTVADTGIGIPSTEQAQIFSEFHRTTRSVALGYRGLGLGLAICKRLIELHGGSIGASSSGIEGEGSVFSFRLPTIPAPAGAEMGGRSPVAAHTAAGLPYAPQPPSPDTMPPQRTILVVDDDPETLDLHARIAQAHSPANQVLRAHSGRAALAILARVHVDLVLLDLTMPELDGFAVLDAMRAEDTMRDIPVIVVTGKILSETEMARLNQGVTAVMGKGLYNLDETLAHLDSALAHKRKLNSEAQRLVRKAMAYLHEHYAEPLTRQAIAEHVGLDEDYLTYCFRQELGITPITYLNRCRINRAKYLLKHTGATVTAIALQVGFSDSGYFSRVFRREVGTSPDAFRRT